MQLSLICQDNENKKKLEKVSHVVLEKAWTYLSRQVRNQKYMQLWQKQWEVYEK